MPTRAERLEEFFRRLAAEPVTSSIEEAYNQICVLLDATEDDLTGIPNDPTAMGRDGRLYPPQMDREVRDPGPIGVRAFRNRRHVTFIGRNGSIEVADHSSGPVFRTAGADGLQIRQLLGGGDE